MNKVSNPKMPKKLWVVLAHDGGEKYYVPHEHIEDAVDDSGPSRVGVYELVGYRMLSKQLVEKVCK